MMGWVEEKVTQPILKPIVKAVEGVGKIVEGGLKEVTKAVSGVVGSIGKTIQGVLDNPIPTLLQVAGAYVGIPPYVTAAAITAMQGGKLEDIAKSAAISYASTQLISNTSFGKTVGDATKAYGNDFTNTMMENFNLPPDTAVAIARASTAAMNSSIIGGVNAALTGKSIASGISSGFTSGLVYSSTDSFFDTVNKDPNWGFSKEAVNLMKGSTSTALNTIISGKGDPAQAIGNYIAYAGINMAGTAVADKAKEAYKLFTTDTEAAKKAQDAYTTTKANYDQKIADGEKLRTSINSDSEAYKKTIDEQYKPFQQKYDSLVADNQKYVDEFNRQKGIYDERKAEFDKYGNQENADGVNAAAAAANAAAENATRTSNEANKLYSDNKPMLDGLTSAKTSLETRLASLDAIKNDVEKPNADGTNLAAKLKTTSDEYQNKYDAWAKTKEASDRSAENYTKAVAEAATRNATIDGLNTGAIKATGKDADGNWTLSNNMTLTTDGKFMQDGKQAFVNTAGVPQIDMDFKAADGTKVDFDENAGRTMSTTDAQAVLKRDYNINASEEEAKKFAGTAYGKTDAEAMDSFANQKVRDAYFKTVGVQPTDEQVEEIRTLPFSQIIGEGTEYAAADNGVVSDAGPDITTAAQAYAVNGLDLPEDYKFPDLNTKVTFGNAYSAARTLYGPGATFSWTDPKTGKTGLYTTENREEQTVRLDKAAEAAGKYDNKVVSYAKYKMLDNLSSMELNPADLTKGEMTSFVDAYSKATPLQRAAMLKGADGSTFKVIDTVLGETARYNPTGKVVSTYTGPSTGTISAYNPTGVDRILDYIKTGKDVGNTALTIATADAAGVVTRGAQLLRDSLGLDNTTADKIQQMWTDSKDKSLNKLASDDQRVIAGGLASGLESVGAFAASGPVGALITLGAIAANNSYQEGATTWIDDNDKTYATKEEAIRAAGQSNIRQLTPEENMKRTAVMTSLEIAGEALGIPGMSKLMKGIPLTGSTAQIVNSVKNFALGLGNEQASELLTTTAQMSADKWLSFGLGKNATLDDYTKALKDTALATTAAVGTAGSISTANRNMQDLKSFANPFSTNTAFDSVTPTIPSLKEAAATLGITDNDFSAIQRNITNSVRAGNNYVGSAEDMLSQSLQNKGMSTVKADAVASQLADKIETVTVNDFLTANGIDPAKILALTPVIKSQLNADIDTGVAAKNMASIFTSAGMDPTLAGKTAAQFYSYTVAAPVVTQADIDLSNKLLSNAGLEIGTIYKSPTGAVSTVKSTSGSTVTDEQLQNTFGTTGTTGTTTGTTTGGTTGTGTTTGNYSTTGTLTGGTTGTTTGTVTKPGDVQTTINSAISGVTLPAGVTKEDVSGAITDYMVAHPGLSANDVATVVTNYMRANPPLNIADVNKAIAAATSGLATKADIDKAITGIQFPVGITKADVSSAITAAMAANPGLSAVDVATQIANYMKANPGITAAEVNAAVTNATKDFATKKDIDTAISGIQFPAGLTKEDVSKAIGDYMTANPGLKAADVATQIANYMKANPVATPADLNTAINNATKNLVTNTNLDSAISGLTKAQQDQYNQLSQQQKDIIASQFKQGVDLNTSIANVQQNVANLESSFTKRFNELVNQGVNQQAAIQQAIQETQGQITAGNTQVNQRIADLVAQGMTNQQATDQAIKETQASVTNLGTKLDTRINELVTQGLTNQQATAQAIKETQASVTNTETKLNTRINELVAQGLTNQEATNQAIKETQGEITNLKTDLNTRISELVAQGLSNQEATNQAIKETQNQVTQTKEELGTQITKTNTDLTKKIEDTSTTFNNRVDELVQQGKTYQEATDQAFKETNQSISDVQKAQDEAKKAKEAADKAARAKEAQSKTASNLAQAASLVAMPAAAAAGSDESTAFKNIGLKTTGETKFEGPLEQYLKMVKGTNYAQKPAEAQQQQSQQQVQQGPNVQQDLLTPQPDQQVAGSDYFNYGQQTDIDQLLGRQVAETNGTMQAKRGGLATPLMAKGGTTRYGRYAGGGLNVVQHSGKARVDFRTGDAVTGPGDGQSDDIPAMLADGEFVFPADVVSSLGNGSTKAGSDKLYDMMHSIRAYHRSAKPEDLPPPAKQSPLDYLKTRKARR